MGCDIHFFVEVKQADGTWKWVKDKDKPFYDGRNYDLFAILADVRNGHGFAGSKTGDGFNPISDPRGLPTDASSEVREKAEDWGDDGHSHSYLSVAELRSFDWGQTTGHQGHVNLEGFKEYLQKGKPSAWCGGVGGGAVRNVSIEAMTEMVKGNIPLNEHWYTVVSWTETYAASVGDFLTETLPKLEALGAPEDVRCVFWFDN